MKHKQPKPPRDLAGYFESMTRVVFSSGMSWRVVEAKWAGIRKAFREFDPERVARMTARDIDRLANDTRVIRNVRKIEAIILNAKELTAIGKTPAAFRGYLASLGGFDETTAALRTRFRYLGRNGSFYFLWSVGETVPSWEEWSGSHEQRDHLPPQIHPDDFLAKAPSSRTPAAKRDHRRAGVRSKM